MAVDTSRATTLVTAVSRDVQGRTNQRVNRETVKIRNRSGWYSEPYILIIISCPFLVLRKRTNGSVCFFTYTFADAQSPAVTDPDTRRASFYLTEGNSKTHT